MKTNTEHQFNPKICDSPIIVGVVGPNFSGKTTLIRTLAQNLSFVPIEEPWKNNPKLLHQKEEPLANQLWFLEQSIQAMHQATAIRQKGNNVAVDTIPHSTLIYSQAFLSESDFSLFRTSWEGLADKILFPNLVIHLRATPDFLFNERRSLRIQDKSGPITDLTVSLDWCTQTCKLHEDVFDNWKNSPIVVVDIQHSNPVHDHNDFEDLVRQMSQALSSANILYQYEKP